MDKKTTPRIKGTKINSKNKELTEELHKSIIRKVKKRKVYSPFRDNIWGADLPDVQLLSKFNKGTCFLLCVNNIISKLAWVVPLKDERDITITDAFQKILNECVSKPNKIWVDKESEFYNKLLKSRLQKN